MIRNFLFRFGSEMWHKTRALQTIQISIWIYEFYIIKMDRINCTPPPPPPPIAIKSAKRATIKSSDLAWSNRKFCYVCRWFYHCCNVVLVQLFRILRGATQVWCGLISSIIRFISPYCLTLRIKSTLNLNPNSFATHRCCCSCCRHLSSLNL